MRKQEATLLDVETSNGKQMIRDREKKKISHTDKFTWTLMFMNEIRNEVIWHWQRCGFAIITIIIIIVYIYIIKSETKSFSQK